MNYKDKRFLIDCLTYFVFIELLIAGAVIITSAGSHIFGLCCIMLGLAVNQAIIYKVKKKC